MSNLIDETIGKHIADDFVIGDRKQGEEAISNMVERINNKIRNRNNIKNVTDDDTFAKVKDVMLQLDVPDQLEIIYHYYYDIGLIDQNFVKDMFGELIKDTHNRNKFVTAILLVGGTLLVMIVTVSLVYGAFSGTLDPNSILGAIVGWMGEIAKAFFIDIN